MNAVRARLLAGAIAVVAGCGGRVDDVLHEGPDPQGGTTGSEGGAAGAGGRASGGGRASPGGGSSNGGGTDAPSSGGRTAGGAGGSSAGGSSAGGAGGTAGSGGEASSGGGGGLSSAAGGAATEVWVGKVQRSITYDDHEDGVETPQNVVMVLQRSAGGILSGSVLFGDREPPGTPTDPEAFYPVLDDYTLWQTMKHAPLDGFAYTLMPLSVQDGRVTGKFAPGELWKAWCAIQPEAFPSRFPGEPDTCAPPDAPLGTDEAPRKAALCRSIPVCDCTGGVCRPHLDRNLWTLDLQLRGDLYEGEVQSDRIVGGGVWLFGVRLRRVQE